MRCGTIIPLIKRSYLDPASLENYRAITLSSLIGKVIDHMIMNRYESIFKTDKRQFAFKKGASCNQCTFVLQEVARHFINNGSCSFACLLDLKKAFDRVNLSKLFDKLRSCGAPPHMLRALMGLYSDQHLRVQWNGAFSDEFSASNGVKQGGVLSPVLFCVYLDDLFKSLANLDLGCHVGSTFYGALAFADDLTLLSPSAIGLNTMLRRCYNYAIFSVAKSVCIRLGLRDTKEALPTVTLGGTAIPWAQQVKHLGHIISSDLTDSNDINDKVNAFYGQVNGLIFRMKRLRVDLLAKMFMTYCTSFYGCELWDPSDKNTDMLSVAWRKAVRRIWQLPYTTHCGLLPGLMNGLSAIDVIMLRTINFVNSNLSSTNVCLKYISQFCMSRTFSHTGRVMALFAHDYCRNFKLRQLFVERNTNAHSDVLLELCMVKSGTFCIDGFDLDEVATLITHIATM